MSSTDGPQASAARTTVAVLLAVVFLTVIGASLGVIVGMRQLAKRTTLSQDLYPATASATASASPERSDRPTTGPSPSRSATAPPAPTPGGARTCPEPMEKQVRAQGAAADLKLVLYIETSVAEVWVCRARDDVLWYQGHRKSGPDARYPKDDLVPGVNSLLLGHVKALPGERYEAVNANADGATKYTVSTSSLITTRTSQSPETQTVIAHYP